MYSGGYSIVKLKHSNLKYEDMLNKICKLMDKVTAEEKMQLIDKYIRILELLKIDE